MFLLPSQQSENTCASEHFSPSHSSYDNGDNLFFLFIRSLLLPGICQSILLSPFPPLPFLPFLCALLVSDSVCLSVALKTSVMAFFVNPRQYTFSYNTDERISDVGWLKLSSTLQQLHSDTSNTNVPRSACSLAAALSCHL